MASNLEAVVFGRGDVTPLVPDGIRIVRLVADFAMLPITAATVEHLDPAAVGDERIPAGWNLRQPVAAPARSISADRAVVYLH